MWDNFVFVIEITVHSKHPYHLYRTGENNEIIGHMVAFIEYTNKDKENVENLEAKKSLKEKTWMKM